MDDLIRTKAAPYIDTAKPEDMLDIVPCDNPAGWWTVRRNGRPIHHWQDRDDAEAFRHAIANAPNAGPV